MARDPPSADEVAQIGRYFSSYVLAGTKAFAPDQVRKRTGKGAPQYFWGCLVPGSPSTTLEYDHQGVQIEWYSRVTTHLGDTDRFTDLCVRVDGQTVAEFQ